MGAGVAGGSPLNIVVILSDQLRADCVGCYGNPIIRTPHIDALAASGTRFAQAFSQHPQCAPSRSSILTSRYPHVNGSTSNYVAMGDHELTLPEYLRGRGYRTAGTGKLHLSATKLQAGFDELIQSEGQHSGATDPEVLHPHYKAWLKANGYWETAVEAFAMHGRPEYLEGFRAAVNPLPEPAYFDGWVGDRTVELIGRHPVEQPLFLFVGLPNPHIPFDAPEPYASMYDPDALPLPPTFGMGMENKPPQHLGYKRAAREDFERLDETALRRVMALYYGSISLVDTQVGKVMAALEARGMLERTVVAFLSDHGELLGHFGMLIKSIDEYPMLYDVGLHVPLIVRSPGGDGGDGGQVVADPVELVDLAPTLLSCAGLEVPPEMQGMSQRAALYGGAAMRREYVFAEAGAVKMVRGERYKLVHYPGQPYGELYDLQRDPHEADNRYDDPDLEPQRERLTRALLDRLIAAEAPLHGESQRGPAYWRRQYRLPFKSEA